MQLTRTVTAALALVATAAVTAACTGTAVEGNPLAGDTLRPTEELKSAELPATPPPVPAVVYEDVTGQGVVTLDRGEPSPQSYRALPAPGVTVVAADDGMCTLGPAVRTADGTMGGWVTAAHCNPTVGDRMLSYNSSWDQQLIPLAAMSDVEDDDAGIDSGAVFTDVPGTAVLAETWPVAGVLTRSGVEDLPLDTPVCVLGAVSGVQCGPLWGIDSYDTIRFDAAAHEGDSGGAVFVVDVATGAATLLGILSQIGDDPSAPTAYATLLDDALGRMRVTAVVDPAAKSAVAGQPGYSTRTAALG